jgi:hypothetical protein
MIRYEYKMTSELSDRDAADIVDVLGLADQYEDACAHFRWKYFKNPEGDSLHVTAYDGDLPVGSTSFWPCHLGSERTYQLVDAAVRPSHRRQGIFREGIAGSVARLEGSPIFTCPGYTNASLPLFLSIGWTVHRRAPLSIHFGGGILRRCKRLALIPDDYVLWRFAGHAKQSYRFRRRGNDLFLLGRKRGNWYVALGAISSDFGLEEASPKLFLSYDVPNGLLRPPRKGGFVLECPGRPKFSGFFPSYRIDTL